MSREEIVNNIGYQLTRAAIDHIEKHEFADSMDCFEVGAEWMQKKMIDKACEWIKKEVLDDYQGVIRGNIVEDFRKAMEE